MNEANTEIQRNVAACQVNSNVAGKKMMCLLVLTKDRLIELTPPEAEVKPGGRFHPRKQAVSAYGIFAAVLYGALGGILGGIDSAADNLKAWTLRLDYLIEQEPKILLAEYPAHVEMAYSEVKQVLWNKWSAWSGQKFSFLLMNGTRRDYDTGVFPKGGRSSFEQTLARNFGDRFQRIG